MRKSSNRRRGGALRAVCDQLERRMLLAAHIHLNPSTVAENVPVGTAVGSFNLTGASGSYVLSLSGADASAFTITSTGGGSGEGQLFTNAPIDFEAKSSYSITVSGDNGAGSKPSAGLTIAITNVNETPTSISLAPSSIAENAGANALVGAFATTDPDAANTFTYTFAAGGADNAAFTITGNQLFENSSFDFEAKSSYSIAVRSTDQGGLWVEKTIAVNVTDVNETPTDIALDSNVVAENAATPTVIGNLSASDADAGDTFTYALVAGQGNNDQFSITGNVLSATASFDFEATPTRTVVVEVQDAGGLTFQKTSTINVTNVNETPTDIALDASVVAENAAIPTVIGSLSGSDPDAGDTFTYSLVAGQGNNDQFSIAGNVLSATASFDFEATPTRTVVVEVQDAGGLTFQKTFTINVTNVNETPTGIALDSNVVAENAATPTVIGNLSGADPDAGDTFTYALVAGQGNNDQFSITGNVLSATASFDFEATPTRTVVVEVQDAGGLTFQKTFTVNVTNVNETPTDIALDSNVVAENAATPTVIGNLSGTDPDAGDTFTYALVAGQGNNDQFSITGNVLSATASFDFEATPTRTVVVEVQDAGGLTFQKTFTIDVTGINETPTDIALDNNVVAEYSATPTVIGNLSASDPDAGDTFTYSLVAGQGNNDQFSITGNVLSATASFDFQSTPTQTVVVEVQDAAGLTFQKTFTVDVSGINKTPTDIALDNTSVAENASAPTVIGYLSGTAPGNGTITYSLVAGTGSGGNGLFQIVGDQLQSKVGFNYEAKTYYNVRVRATNPSGSFERSFTIQVSDVAEPLVIDGTGGNDAIALSISGSQLIVSLNGLPKSYDLATQTSITVNCNGGDDVVTIGSGVPGVTVWGGDGNDVLTGGDAADWIDGQAGDDLVHGGGGNDVLAGGWGNDTLYGDAGNDAVHGGRGDDIIHGGSGNDALYGDKANDTLYGEKGANYLDAGPGPNDVIYARNGVMDTVVGGGGLSDSAQIDDMDLTLFSDVETLLA